MLVSALGACAAAKWSPMGRGRWQYTNVPASGPHTTDHSGPENRRGGYAMGDQPNPHDQHDSELQLVLTIGIEGFRELVAWVAEGDTVEDRHARGSQVREVIDDVVRSEEHTSE